jgi:hypothetical protein
MTSQQWVPAVLIPVILWRLYTRVRRNIGRQRFRPTRLIVAVVLLTAVLALIGFSAARVGTGGWCLAGALVAVPIGFLALRLTRFEASPEGVFYTPNTTIGLAVAGLFVGRVIYRMFTLMGSETTQSPMSRLTSTPLTLIMLGATIGFYIIFNIGLLVLGRRQSAPNK